MLGREFETMGFMGFIYMHITVVQDHSRSSALVLMEDPHQLSYSSGQSPTVSEISRFRCFYPPQSR